MSDRTPDHFPSPGSIRQRIRDREIGGECSEAVLVGALGRCGLSRADAIVAIHEAHVAGYIRPGFHDRDCWGTVTPAPDEQEAVSA